MKVLKVDAEEPETERIEKAAAIIRKGGIVVFPTDTVYGLGADAFNPSAVERIYQVKGRSRAKPLPVQVSTVSEMEPLVEGISPLVSQLAHRFWPGPLTLILKASSKIPAYLTAGGAKIGVRIPDSKIALRFLEACRVPLVVPSANRSGDKEPLTAREAVDNLPKKIDLVLDGGIARWGKPSTVLDLTVSPPEVLRLGAVEKEEIEKALGEIGSTEVGKPHRVVLFVCTGNSCRSVMAEALFRKMAEEDSGRKDIEVISAGTAAPVGMKVPWQTMEVLKGEDVDVSSHRAVQIQKELVERTDIILVMEKRQHKTVVDLCPSAADRVFLLSQFSSDPQKKFLDIPDPIGCPLETYRECLKDIKECLKGVMEKLEGGHERLSFLQDGEEGDKE